MQAQMSRDRPTAEQGRVERAKTIVLAIVASVLAAGAVCFVTYVLWLFFQILAVPLD